MHLNTEPNNLDTMHFRPRAAKPDWIESSQTPSTNANQPAGGPALTALRFTERTDGGARTRATPQIRQKKIQILGALNLLTIPLVLLPTFVVGAQQDPTTDAGRLPGAEVRQSANETLIHHPHGDVETFAPTVKKVAPAVVRIVTTVGSGASSSMTGKPSWRRFLAQAPQSPSPRLVQCGLGSGVIVTEDGYILTNCHLVNGSTEVIVTLQDGREFNAKVIGLDARTDIAVIKIKANDLPTVELAESHNVQVGDVVLAIGNPFGVGQTVTHGIVSAIDRGGMGIQDYESFIQTDAPINPGNSGGALVDVTGGLIGINTAIISSSGGNLGIGFAVPSDLARKVMADLVKHGHVIRGYLGVDAQDLTRELAKEFKLDRMGGALVGGVVPNGPGEKAGVEVGDVITKFDGKTVRGARELGLMVAEVKPGQTVLVEVLHNGASWVLTTTIGQASGNDLLATMDRSSEEPDDPDALQGVTIGELNSELRQQLRTPRHLQGAVVLNVNPYSTAAEAGLRPGDVIVSMNRHDVRNSEDVSRLTQHARNKRMLLRVWSIGGNRFVLVDDSPSA